MIELSDINLNYSKTVFKNANFVIYDNTITVISGKSGCGKTSLLYMLGLIAPLSLKSYIFDGKELTKLNKSEKAKFRKQYISYIFQTKNVIMDFSCYDNVVLAYKLYNIDYNDEIIKNVLNKVGLLHRKNTIAKSLSGGELQRLAIVIGLIKKPQLLILDEPTSSLDLKNKQLIMNLLLQIKKEYPIKIIIASHDTMINEIADVIYHIENYRLELFKKCHNDCEIVKLPEKKNFSLKDFNRYYYKLNEKKSMLLNRIFLIISSISITCCLIGVGLKNGYLLDNKKLMQEIQTNEFQIVNNMIYEENAVKDTQYYKSLDHIVINQLKEETYVTLYPFFEVNGYDINMKSTLYYGNQYIEDLCITVIPYYPETKLEKYITRGTYCENGIYISSLIYRHFDNDYDQKITGSFQFPVIKNINGFNEYKSKSLELTINGVLDSDFKNPYSQTSEAYIYVPYEFLNNIMLELNASYLPSSVVGYVDNYLQLYSIKDKLKNYETISFKTSLLQVEKILNDTKNYEQIIITGSMTLFIVSGLLLSLYFNQKVGFKKYEYALLRVMGMDIKDIIQLNLFEYLFFVSKSGLISLVSVLVVGNFIEPLFNLTYSLKFIEMIGLLCFFLFISILVPIVLSVVKVNKYDPAVIFRD